MNEQQLLRDPDIEPTSEVIKLVANVPSCPASFSMTGKTRPCPKKNIVKV
jgi:hypothetical protein